MDYIKGVCKDYNLDLASPETVTTYHKAREALAESKNVSHSNLIQVVDENVTNDYEFLTR